MASACERLDELVKEYLLFRGFTAATKALDHEMKHDKDKGLRADKIVEQLVAYVGSHDLQHLREYWAHLNQRFFSRLEQRYATSVRKLEVNLLKLYIVNAHQSNRQDRVRDFFEKTGPELQNQPEFRDWFAFPFLTNPAENVTFALYFTRQWQETMQLSLHNFLQVVLQAMPVPTLLSFDQEARRMQAMQDENEMLKNQIHYGTVPDKKTYRMRPTDQSVFTQPLPDLIYDFSGLADASHERGSSEPVNERQKTSRRFPINLSGPLLKRNRQPEHRQDSAASNSHHSGQANFSNNASTDFQPHPASHAHPSAASMGAGVTMTMTSNPSSSVPGGVATSGQRPSVARAVTEPQTTVAHAAGQPVGTGDAATPPGTRKKGPRELTSFPPYASPQVEKSDPSPAKTSSHATSEQPRGQGQVQGDKVAVRAEAAVREEASAGDGQTAASVVDYGPVDNLQPIPEGKQCPFLVLSDDEYLEHRSAVCYSRFSLSGQFVASLDTDGIVKVWTWSPQPSTVATVMSRAPFLSLDWASKSDRWLLLGNQSGQIRLYDKRETKTFREASVESPHLRVTYLSTCPATMTFASCLSTGLGAADSGPESGRVAVWDLKTMKMERYLTMDSQVVAMSCCLYNSNGRQLLAGDVDGTVRLFDVSQRQCVRTWRTGRGCVQTLQFAHQEASFFTMGPEGTLSEWSLTQTSRPLRQIRINETAGGPPAKQTGQSGDSGPSGQLFSLNKDKSYLLCGIQRRGVICKTGEGQGKTSMQRILDLSSHSDSVTTVDWSPCIDTPVCVTGSRDGRLKVATLLSQ